ncbi:MAG: septal ring lytic transglycosylase RlpA family protein [Pseudomonadales bacterium]|nr:septal ring lytic transglycosylase RlpA family protein [Pseudomonadales bacterium]
MTKIRFTLKLIFGILFSFLVVNCSTYSPRNTTTEEPPSRYHQKQDSAPFSYHDLERVPDATPTIEPLSRQGNKSPYEVAGKSYQVMQSSAGYQETGTASWYGKKFHGYLTSNGETYNMFGMSAAHRTLPLPTYLQVTNLDNGRQVIVRVNDRGPFHSERIIDLSYAAAIKLGFADKGTAAIKIEAVDPVAWQWARMKPKGSGDEVYLQVGAFSKYETANQLKKRVQAVTDELVVINLDTQRKPNLHKVQIGPLKNMALVQQIKEKLATLGLGNPLIVSMPRS